MLFINNDTSMYYRIVIHGPDGDGANPMWAEPTATGCFILMSADKRSPVGEML